MKKLMLLLLPALAAVPMFAQKDASARLEAATSVMNDMMKASDKGIPQDLLAKAECVVVIPNLKKGGFIVGAKYGKGFFSCRKDKGPGWSAPAGVIAEGGSFGFLIGGAETDIIMLVMNREGAKSLLSSKFTLGGDVSAAAGPVGRDSSAMTDAIRWPPTTARGWANGASGNANNSNVDAPNEPSTISAWVASARKDRAETANTAPAEAKAIWDLLNTGDMEKPPMRTIHGSGASIIDRITILMTTPPRQPWVVGWSAACLST